MIKKILILILVLALGAGIWYYETQVNTLDVYGPYAVSRVVDGDTIDVEPLTDQLSDSFDDTDDTSSDAIRIRLIGVDAPESVHPDESKNTAEGIIASDFMKNLLYEGAWVYLEYDTQETDSYGRTLAYMYIDSDDADCAELDISQYKKYHTSEGNLLMVQEILLTEGMATTMTVQPNSKYEDRFYKLQVQARNAETGFWGDAVAPESLVGEWYCQEISYYALRVGYDGEFSIYDYEAGNPGIAGTMEDKGTYVAISCDEEDFDPPYEWNIDYEDTLDYEVVDSDTIKLGHGGNWLTFERK